MSQPPPLTPQPRKARDSSAQNSIPSPYLSFFLSQPKTQWTFATFRQTYSALPENEASTAYSEALLCVINEHPLTLKIFGRIGSKKNSVAARQIRDAYLQACRGTPNVTPVQEGPVMNIIASATDTATITVNPIISASTCTSISDASVKSTHNGPSNITTTASSSVVQSFSAISTDTRKRKRSLLPVPPILPSGANLTDFAEASSNEEHGEYVLYLAKCKKDMLSKDYTWLVNGMTEWDTCGDVFSTCLKILRPLASEGEALVCEADARARGQPPAINAEDDGIAETNLDDRIVSLPTSPLSSFSDYDAASHRFRSPLPAEKDADWVDAIPRPPSGFTTQTPEYQFIVQAKMHLSEIKSQIVPDLKYDGIFRSTHDPYSTRLELGCIEVKPLRVPHQPADDDRGKVKSYLVECLKAIGEHVDTNGADRKGRDWVRGCVVVGIVCNGHTMTIFRAVRRWEGVCMIHECALEVDVNNLGPFLEAMWRIRVTLNRQCRVLARVIAHSRSRVDNR